MEAELAIQWQVLLDLGADRRATVHDALYLEAALRECGIRTVFYPWHPKDDVLAPIGSARPLKLLVEPDRFDEASELRDDVLAGRPESPDVVIPVDDTWVRRFDIRILLGRLAARSRDEGGVWTVSLWLVRIVVAAILAAAAIALVAGLFDAIRDAMTGF